MTVQELKAKPFELRWRQVFSWQTVTTPAQTFWGVKLGLGQPFMDIFEPDWNMLLSLSNFKKKTLPLHIWRPFDYKSHIECTSPSRSKIQYIQYVQFQLANKQLIEIYFQKWNHQWSTYLTLEVKKFTKSSLTLRL